MIRHNGPNSTTKASLSHKHKESMVMDRIKRINRVSTLTMLYNFSNMLKDSLIFNKGMK